MSLAKKIVFCMFVLLGAAACSLGGEVEKTDTTIITDTATINEVAPLNKAAQNYIENFWGQTVLDSSDVCSVIQDYIVNSKDIPVHLYHNVDKKKVSLGCQYFLTLWKITYRLPSVESDMELLSQLLSLHRQGVKSAGMTLLYIKEVNKFPFDLEKHGLSKEVLTSYRLDRIAKVRAYLEVKATVDRMAEHKALLPLARAGSSTAAYELAYLNFIEAGHLTADGVAWYRIALFLGEHRAARSLGAFYLRYYAAETALDVPEGSVSGLQLLENGLNYLARDNGSASSIGDVAQVEAFKASGSIGDVITDEAKTYLANVQPVGHILYNVEAADLYFERSKYFNDVIHNHIASVNGQEYPDLKVSLYAPNYRARDYLVAITGWEIIDPVGDHKVLQAGTFKSLTGALPGCDNWYDPQACPTNLEAVIALDGANIEQKGLLILRLLSGNNAPYGLIPVFVKLEKESVAPAILLYPDYTWQAYNGAFGGSLYESDKDDLYAASLSRPVDQGVLVSLFNYRSSLPAARRYEALGISVHHVPQSALHEEASKPSYKKSVLLNYNSVTLAGHDEYWDDIIETDIRSYVASGGHLLSLSGNTAWWKVRRNGEVLVVDKSDLSVVVNDRFEMGFDFSRSGLKLLLAPEERIETLTGSTYESGGYAKPYYISPESAAERQMPRSTYLDSQALFVVDPLHKVFDAMGVVAGDRLCENIPVLNAELDGVPLLGASTVNFQWLPTANKSVKPLAASYMFNHNFPAVNGRKHAGIVHYSGVLIETSYGKGEVLTLGSMGAYALFGNSDTSCRKLGDNILTYFSK